jgi:hypothetical protein
MPVGPGASEVKSGAISLKFQYATKTGGGVACADGVAIATSISVPATAVKIGNVYRKPRLCNFITVISSGDFISRELFARSFLSVVSGMARLF